MAYTPKEKMVKARSELIMLEPFFGSLALRLKLQEDPSVKTSVCDGATIRYNPEFIEELSLSKAIGHMAHLVMGPALLHHIRRGSREVDKWNKASDYVINPILEKAGFDLPSGTFNNPAYAGKSIEEIYELILAEDDGEGGDGKGKGKGKGNSNDNNNGNGDNNDDDGSGQNDPGGDGGVSDSPNSQNQGASAGQQKQEENDWKEAVSQAAYVAKQQGKLPGDMERLMEDLFTPQLPWRNILRRFMTEKANDDFSWARGNRRFIAQGLYLPSRYSEGSGEIAIMIDTSCSIGQKELDTFGSEAISVIKEARPSKTYVIYCDSHVQHVDVFGPDDDIQFKLHGGGGTDFRPPFKWLEEHGIVPKCAVYLTDGYGPFPVDEDEPHYPTLWCIDNYDVVPPIGEHLIIEHGE